MNTFSAHWHHVLAIPFVACFELHFQSGFELRELRGAVVFVRLSLACWGCFMDQSLHPVIRPLPLPLPFRCQKTSKLKLPRRVSL